MIKGQRSGLSMNNPNVRVTIKALFVEMPEGKEEDFVNAIGELCMEYALDGDAWYFQFESDEA